MAGNSSCWPSMANPQDNLWPSHFRQPAELAADVADAAAAEQRLLRHPRAALLQAVPHRQAEGVAVGLAVVGLEEGQRPHPNSNCAKRIRTAVSAVDEGSECKPDRAQPARKDRAQFLNPQLSSIKIARGHRPRLQSRGNSLINPRINLSRVSFKYLLLVCIGNPALLID